MEIEEAVKGAISFNERYERGKRLVEAVGIAEYMRGLRQIQNFKEPLSEPGSLLPGTTKTFEGE